MPGNGLCIVEPRRCWSYGNYSRFAGIPPTELWRSQQCEEGANTRIAAHGGDWGKPQPLAPHRVDELHVERIAAMHADVREDHYRRFQHVGTHPACLRRPAAGMDVDIPAQL